MPVPGRWILAYWAEVGDELELDDVVAPLCELVWLEVHETWGPVWRDAQGDEANPPTLWSALPPRLVYDQAS